MGKFVVGKEAAREKAFKALADAQTNVARNIEALIVEIDTEIKALTPVYTGQAVRNYIWSAGSPSSVTYDAIDSGPTGHTNSMALGSEPRRPANAAAALESLLALGIAGDPFRKFYLSNNSPDITGLELGILPGPPLASRSPAGMFGLVHAFVNVKINAKGILS